MGAPLVGTQGHGQACWDRRLSGRLPSPTLPRQKPFPPYLQTGWNSPRASLNKQSLEKSELPNTNHIKIEFHADARQSLAFGPPTGASSKPPKPGAFRGQKHSQPGDAQVDHVGLTALGPSHLPGPQPQAAASPWRWACQACLNTWAREVAAMGTLYFLWGPYLHTPGSPSRRA